MVGMRGVLPSPEVTVPEAAELPRPRRVLVVDDDDEMRALLRRTLEFDGYQVTERDRGTHVVETLRGAPFDLIILDKEMPGLTGLDLLPVLRREFPHVPVVFVTAFGGRQVAANALRLGATRYLEKPFRLGQLRDTIDGLISRSAETPRSS
jgi:DNA-binding response OmpR family regulator